MGDKRKRIIELDHTIADESFMRNLTERLRDYFTGFEDKIVSVKIEIKQQEYSDV